MKSVNTNLNLSAGHLCFAKPQESLLCRAVVWRRACQHRNTNDSKPREGPDDLMPSVYVTEPLGERLTGTLSDIRKNRVHQGIDDKRSNIISNVDEELMPTLRLIFLQNVNQAKQARSSTNLPDSSGK
jgi:hypothetical protein